MNPGRNFFYLLSFIEGACVMAAELMGAKMMAPFYGSSLYVWASVMAITLVGLASGYFAGGVLSSKKNPAKILYLCMMLAGVFTILMPFAAK
ncbi:MAG: fused MFS/spermidine synthase, partial [Bacteroidota bacterium]